MSTESKPGWLKGLDAVRYVGSMVLLIFSITVVSSAIKTNQTNANAANNNVPTGASFVIMWFCVLFLAIIEGGQGCLVGLQPVDKALYAKSHPWAHKNTVLAHKGDNLERYVVGRQFNVVLIVFVISIVAGGVKGGCVFDFNSTVCDVFVSNGVALILFVIMVGQLTAQVNAAVCMLDFINNVFMYGTTLFALGIEITGLLHSVYFFGIGFSKLTGTPIESNEPPKTGGKLVFFWTQVIISLAALCFCLAIVLEGLQREVTGMWEGTPIAVSYIAFFLLLIFVGIMEGMQIAAFKILKQPRDSYKDNYKIADKNCVLMFKGDNLGRFLIGRQICVTSCMFVVAKIATCDKGLLNGENLFGFSDSTQEFINTGLPGALVTTVIGSLIWRILANNFPFAFMSNPVIFVIIWLCLALEAIGICSAPWVLGWFQKKVMGWATDDVYIGKPEAEKENKEQKDLELAEQDAITEESNE